MRSIVSVSLPGKMALQLERLVRRTGRTKSSVMEEALGRYLWEERFKATRRSVIHTAKATGVVTDADVFKAVRDAARPQ